jgi:ribonucleoside-diphosphate reductase alpha chain
MTFDDTLNDFLPPENAGNTGDLFEGKEEIKNTHRNNFDDFSMATFRDSYFLESEKHPFDLYRRVADYYGSDSQHADRLFSYMAERWFSPATPILSNGGTNRGLPISCYVTEMQDSLDSIASKWNEQVFLGAKGGGVGTSYSNLRSVGERVGGVGKTSGIIPFIKVQESQTVAVNQGSLRRSNSAIYLHVSHPEIEEFISLRRVASGDPMRKALHIHHGIFIDDAFIKAVLEDMPYNLLSPKDKSVISIISARSLWARIIETRMETGEPYLVFEDAVNNALPEHHKKLKMRIKTSNLCSEIVLPTGIDYLGKDRTAVCCLSSLNLEYFNEWRNHKTFIKDVMEMLGNVLIDFTKKAPKVMESSIYSASVEKSIGLGVMGLHYYFQKNMIPFDCALAKSTNLYIFKHIKQKVDQANKELVSVFGCNPDAVRAFPNEPEKHNFAFSYCTAIAPTASISILANTSPSVEPLVANVFTQKTKAGFFKVENTYLVSLLKEKGYYTPSVITSILQKKGSVQHLSFLSDDEKAVFKTAKEINQRWIVELAADRTPYIDQAQSINLFFEPNTSRSEVSKIHLFAHAKGIKSLYYCRSASVAKAEQSTKIDESSFGGSQIDKIEADDTCLACQ